MKSVPQPGDTHQLEFVVSNDKTVPRLYPESDEFRRMPEVFATGFLVGLLEWACIEALGPHLEDGEGSLGTAINISHLAATPPGMKVTVTATCLSARGRTSDWRVEARDDRELISEGTHTRAVVAWERFRSKLSEKAAAAAS